MAPNRSLMGTVMPCLATTPRAWVRQLVRRFHQLVPAAHQLPQLPDLGRSQPCLRQPSQPQQVGQVGGVPLVVLHPAGGERLQAKRVGPVGLGTGLGQRIGGPVLPERGLQRHPCPRTGLGDLPLEPGRLIGEPDIFPSGCPSCAIRTGTERCRCRSVSPPTAHRRTVKSSRASPRSDFCLSRASCAPGRSGRPRPFHRISRPSVCSSSRRRRHCRRSPYRSR
jgi:hypothetical protein